MKNKKQKTKNSLVLCHFVIDWKLIIDNCNLRPEGA